jgi:hypothetical protein
MLALKSRLAEYSLRRHRYGVLGQLDQLNGEKIYFATKT